MKFQKLAVLMVVLGLGTTAIRAQETNQVDLLKKQLQELQDNFERVQREQRQQIESLTEKLDALVKQQQTEAEKKKLELQLAAELQTNQPSSQATPTAVAATPWSPSSPIRIGGGGTYADISMVATFAAGGSTASDIEGGTELGGHDPNQRGFTVQGVELNLQGAVDPYFRGNANLSFQIDSGGETSVELEEAWLETVSLPRNLQVRAGQILTEFGRINTQHPHAWAFVDEPLVNGRLLGADGLRNPGVRISWLAPTPFYSELFLSVQNSQGETAFSFRDDHGGDPLYGRLDEQGRAKSFNDMLFAPRYAASFNLSDSQTLVAGTSAAFGPNGSGGDKDTQIYAADLFWKWKSPNQHAGFPFVTWQTEGMVRRYHAGASTTVDLTGDNVPDFVPDETLVDYGVYTQVAYGFRKAWVAALRGDWVSSDEGDYEKLYGRDPDRAARWRISPNLTWFPSEFSKLRLQYNYDDRDGIGVDHSVWFQFEFLLGAHAAHKF